MYGMAGWTPTAVPASAAFLGTTVYDGGAFTVQRRPLPIRVVGLVPPIQRAARRVHRARGTLQHVARWRGLALPADRTAGKAAQRPEVADLHWEAAQCPKQRPADDNG
ncbi:uncharacterized protein LOC123397714 [Hordeum vulgare subsp. vulgare]|uniref:uncharacterized protein LOC123397714 n=1 Tax=Hordeum vulgare subsp. vulgare TaxID=112509 RepID=UPI001D1A4CD7|nr:uncharacterized protein LOC123397714 [Hordeum vulgare subsp. vulgare]